MTVSTHKVFGGRQWVRAKVDDQLGADCMTLYGPKYLPGQLLRVL